MLMTRSSPGKGVAVAAPPAPRCPPVQNPAVQVGLHLDARCSRRASRRHRADGERRSCGQDRVRGGTLEQTRHFMHAFLEGRRRQRPGRRGFRRTMTFPVELVSSDSAAAPASSGASKNAKAVVVAKSEVEAVRRSSYGAKSRSRASRRLSARALHPDAHVRRFKEIVRHGGRSHFTFSATAASDCRPVTRR